MFSLMHVSRRTLQRNVAGAVALTMLLSASVNAAPTIESITPLALPPGVATELTLTGNDLGEATQLWTSFPAEVERTGVGRFRVKPNGPVGFAYLRAFGSNGISNLGFLLLDDLPGTVDSKTNHSQATAQPVSFGNAVDGRADELGYDWFQLRASKGQRVSVEVFAARLGSKLDPVLRVVNAAGRELARNDDAAGLSSESFLSFTAPATGDYFIELRDVNYGGGSAFYYRLRVGDFPLVTTSFPAAVRAGEKQAVELLGERSSAGRVSVTAPTNRRSASIVSVGKSGSAFARVLITDGREVIEREPNNGAEKATRFTLGESLNGRFENGGDRDWFTCEARAGERWEIRAATRSIGSSCEVALRLEDAKGKLLARSNPAAADEGVLTHTFATNGPVRLLVEDTSGATRANAVYRIVTRRWPGFDLTIEADRFNVAPGGAFDLKVTATRGDYKGPITLSLSGLPDGFSLTNKVIAEGKTNITAKVRAPTTLTAGTWHTFAVTGSGKGSPKTTASTLPALRKQLPLMLFPPAELDGALVLGISASK